MQNKLQGVSRGLNRSITGQDGEQIDNPENNFSKLMHIHKDTPIKECKMLLDAMRQQALFQKNIIKKTDAVVVPRHVVSQRLQTQNYDNYQKMLSYSKRKKQAEDFQTKNLSKIKKKIQGNRVKSLYQFVQQKKSRMLTQDRIQSDKLKVQYMLGDDKMRDMLFDESILLERLYFIRKEGMSLKEQQSKIPAKFKGLDPKHLRIPEKCTTDLRTFKRRKYIHNQKTFQYFRNALKTENSLLYNKQKQNGLVIKNLMDHFSDQVLTNQNKMIEKVHRCIRRLFLRYSDGDTDENGAMFTAITNKKMFQFMKDFQIDYTSNQKVLGIMKRDMINQFDFLEILHLLSKKDQGSFSSDVSEFLDERILKHPQKYLPQEWVLYEQHTQFIEKHKKIRRFKQKVQLLYKTFISNKNSNGYNFDQMVQVMWMVKVYPFMIDKKKLQFFYLYTQSHEIGVSVQDIVDIFMYIALAKQGKPQDNIKEIVKKVVQFSKQTN